MTGAPFAFRVAIADPIVPELAERIRALDVVEHVFYDPALLPKPRYPSDHNSNPDVLDDAQRQRFDAGVAGATILYGYPGETAAGLAHCLDIGSGIRYVQGTSAGMGAHIRRAQLSTSVLERVTFCSAAGVHAGMLAEFAFYGILALRKDAERLAKIRAERSWEHYAMGELDGSTIVIVGMGQIGNAVARIARGFNMRVVGVARSAEPSEFADVTVPIQRLGEVSAQADVLLVALPITERTAKIVSAEVIGSLAHRAVVVNLGRGGTVDQEALIEALRSGRIVGAVLDVFDPEPLPAENPLWTMSNVVMSPHTAGLSIRENERIVTLFCDNLERLAAGKALRNRVNLVEYY